MQERILLRRLPMIKRQMMQSHHLPYDSYSVKRARTVQYRFPFLNDRYRFRCFNRKYMFPALIDRFTR